MSDIPGIQHSDAFWTLTAEQMAIKTVEMLNRVMAGGLSEAEVEDAVVAANLYIAAISAFSNLAAAIKTTGLKPRDGMPEIKLPTFDPRDYGNPGGAWLN